MDDLTRHGRREFLGIAAAATFALAAPATAGARAKHGKTHKRVVPRLTRARRRTLGAAMVVTGPPLPQRELTRAVSRFERTYRASSASTRARVEQVIDLVEHSAGGFSTLDPDARRAFLRAHDGHTTGQVADFATVASFRAFVAAQRTTVAAQAVTQGLDAGQADPTLADLPDVTPPTDAGRSYPARTASEAMVLQVAIGELLAFAALPFQDDDLDDD